MTIYERTHQTHIYRIVRGVVGVGTFLGYMCACCALYLVTVGVVANAPGISKDLARTMPNTHY
eukprot:15437286-Alexandrium_andersonii.AAC.1